MPFPLQVLDLFVEVLNYRLVVTELEGFPGLWVPDELVVAEYACSHDFRLRLAPNAALVV